jgi:hypothetical protein
MGPQAVEFANTDRITINTPRTPLPDGSVAPAKAVPYPSIITVSGFPPEETIGKVTVTLHGLSHEVPDDIDMMLVGPEGQSLVLFSDAGGGFVDPDLRVTVTLDDDAEASLPDDDAIVSGVFRPSNYEPEERDNFPAPAPEPSGSARLAVFAETHPNGEWRIYVVDDDALDAGSIERGWSLAITTGERSPTFRRGDSNADGVLNLSDAISTLNFLFQGRPSEPACPDASDADDNGSVSLTDAVYTVNHLFMSGAPPPAPGAEACGTDPTEDGLPCDSFPPCRVCTFPFINCSGICVDPISDPFNCGGCNSPCGPSEACLGGFCESAAF